jgi:hypothetical protein
VDVIMWPAGEPRLDLGCLVGGIVVHDDMDIAPVGDLSVNLLRKFKNSVTRWRL